MRAADTSPDELARALAGVAASPTLTRHLHEILGTYCHQARNILNTLKMSLYLLRRGGGPDEASYWEGLEPFYDVVERFIDRLQQIYRPLPVNPVRLPLGLLIEDRKPTWVRTLDTRERRLVVIPPASEVGGGYDPVRLGQGLDDLIAWRSLAGDPAADLRVRWGEEGGAFHLVFDEPPGSGPIPTPGPLTALDESRKNAYSCLTAPVLARIMTLHGGVLEVNRTDPWCLQLRWPLDSRTTT